MEKGFIARIIKASEDMDTSLYLHCSSFDEAMQHWLDDFSDALNQVINIFEKFEFKITASTFLDKRQEQLHKEYLDRLIQYVDGIDLAFSRKALQYAKIAVKLNGPKDLTPSTLDDLKEAKTYLKDFRTAIERVNKFSHKLMQYAKENKIDSLPKYEYQLARLALFEKLTLDLAIKLLKEKAEI
jgi:hypothetical protein